MEVDKPILKKILCELCEEYEAINKCANCKKCICLKCTDILKYCRAVTHQFSSIVFSACNECSKIKDVRKEFIFEYEMSDEEKDEEMSDEENTTLANDLDMVKKCSIQ